MTDNTDEMFWEYVPPQPTEFRLYYDDKGSIITYTCDKPPGNYLVIDAQVFAEGRPDLIVVDGKLVKPALEVFLSLLSKSDSGTRCASEDVTILVSDEYDGEAIHWELKKYEYKYS
jgi:hypothetical protein